MLVKLAGSSWWHWNVLIFFISMHLFFLPLSRSADLSLYLSVFLLSFSFYLFLSLSSLLLTVFPCLRLAKIRAVHLWVWSYPCDKNWGLVHEILQMLKCHRNASIGLGMIHTLNFWGYDEMKHVYFLWFYINIKITWNYIHLHKPHFVG